MAFTSEGLARRLAERLVACGYVTAEGKPDAARFAREKRYEKQSVYNWLDGTMPGMPALTRLEEDLLTPWEWFVVGPDAIERLIAFRDGKWKPRSGARRADRTQRPGDGANDKTVAS